MPPSYYHKAAKAESVNPLLLLSFLSPRGHLKS